MPFKCTKASTRDEEEEEEEGEGGGQGRRMGDTLTNPEEEKGKHKW